LKFYGIGCGFEIGIKLVFDLDLYFKSIRLKIVSSIGLELDMELNWIWIWMGNGMDWDWTYHLDWK